MASKHLLVTYWAQGSVRVAGEGEERAGNWLKFAKPESMTSLVALVVMFFDLKTKIEAVIKFNCSNSVRICK